MSSRNGPRWRLGAPPGGSILTTSAPRSPSSLPQNWPVSSASSRTLSPARGPASISASVTEHLLHVGKACPLCRPEGAVGETGAQLFVTVSQQAFDNLAGVLTDQRARQVVRCRGFRELERGILHLVQPERRMLHRKIHLAVTQLRV